MSQTSQNQNFEAGDRVTDGDFTGHVTAVGKNKVRVRHYGAGLQEGKIVNTWFYKTSLTIVRKWSSYRVYGTEDAMMAHLYGGEKLVLGKARPAF